MWRVLLLSVSLAACARPSPPAAAAPLLVPPTPSATPPVPAAAPPMPEQAPEPEAEAEPAPAPLRVCRPRALEKALAPFPKNLEFPELGPPTLTDLEPAPVKEGKLGDLDRGLAFFGPLDFDADGRVDRVLLYTSVDYWLWLVFVDRGHCHELVGEVEGYQVEAGKRDASGYRELAAWTYPIMGRRVRYRMSGKGYTLTP